jgi:hypothetical protein
MWVESVQKLEHWLQEKGTHPHIIAIICARLLQWSSGQHLQPIQSNIPGLTDTIHQQDSMGWQSLLEGKWAVGWSILQDKYFKWKGRKNTGRRWLVAVIQKLWDTAWDFWDHRNQVRLVVHEQEARLKAQQAIRDQYRLGQRDLHPNDFRLLFQRPQRDLLADSLSTQQTWIRRIEGCHWCGVALRHIREKNRSRLLLQQWLHQPS